MQPSPQAQAELEGFRVAVREAIAQLRCFLIAERNRRRDSFWSFLPWARRRLREIDAEIDALEKAMASEGIV